MEVSEVDCVSVEVDCVLFEVCESVVSEADISSMTKARRRSSNHGSGIDMESSEPDHASKLKHKESVGFSISGKAGAT